MTRCHACQRTDVTRIEYLDYRGGRPRTQVFYACPTHTSTFPADH